MINYYFIINFTEPFDSFNYVVVYNTDNVSLRLFKVKYLISTLDSMFKTNFGS